MTTRPRGRQAEAERNDRLVLEAARAVVASKGPDATVADIAAVAGVGMGSLYRRYGSKDDLLRHVCTLAMNETIQAAERALAAADPWTGLTEYVTECVRRRTGVLGALAGSIETTPQMWTTSKRSRDLMDQVLGRARDAGVLRPDVTVLDVAWLIEAIGRSGRAEPDGEDAVLRERLTAIALDGLRPATAGHQLRVLAGPPPTRQHYERRWQQPREL
jgi:AcrR family transcriptional regulator